MEGPGAADELPEAVPATAGGGAEAAVQNAGGPAGEGAGDGRPAPVPGADDVAAAGARAEHREPGAAGDAAFHGVRTEEIPGDHAKAAIRDAEVAVRDAGEDGKEIQEQQQKMAEEAMKQQKKMQE